MESGRHGQGRCGASGRAPRRLPRRDLRLIAVFVDTSALYALISDDDPLHPRARGVLAGLRQAGEWLFTHDHVLVETFALLQARHGLELVRRLRDEVVPLLSITWVDAELHRVALAATLADSRDVSLVDHTSFELMRRRNILRAFAFDDHFARQGFELQGAAS